MKKYEKLKIAIIGAGSVSFCPTTVFDILSNAALNTLPLEIALMDIKEDALKVSYDFCQRLRDKKNRMQRFWRH